MSPATAVPTRVDTNLTLAAGLGKDRIDGTKPRECELIADPDVMYPENEEQYDGRGKRNVALDAAKAVCAGCWFRVQCVEEAIERREQFGIWGGLTLRERESIRRRRYPKDNRPPAVTQDEALFEAEELAG